MVENDHDKKNNTGAIRVTFPAGQLTEEFKTQTYMGFEGTRDQVMNALSKQGNESIIQTNVGDTSIATSEQEKKKKERQALNHMLLDAEQYRNNAIGGLQDDINKFQKQLDDKKKEAEGLKLKEQNLLLLQQKRDNGTLDQNDPEDAAKMKQAGVKDVSQIDEALKAVREQKIVAHAEIKALGKKIEHRIEASKELRQNKDAKPEEVNAILKKHGLEMDIEGKSVREIRLELNVDNSEDKDLKSDKQDFVELNEQEISQFMRDQASYEKGDLTRVQLHTKIESLSEATQEFLSKSSPESKALFEEARKQKSTQETDLSSNVKNNLDVGLTTPQVTA